MWKNFEKGVEMVNGEIQVNILSPKAGARIKGTFPVTGRAISDALLKNVRVRFGLAGNIEPGQANDEEKFPVEFDLDDGPDFGTTVRSVPLDEYAEGVISLVVLGETGDGETIIGEADNVILRGGIDTEAITQAIAEMVNKIKGNGFDEVAVSVAIPQR